VSDASGSDAATDSNESADETAAPMTPVLRVVKGDLTPEELAALVAVVAARNAAAAHAASRRRPRPRSEWGHPARMVRTPLRTGADQWRRSAWG
jgi:hypothetical protein